MSKKTAYTINLNIRDWLPSRADFSVSDQMLQVRRHARVYIVLLVILIVATLSIRWLLAKLVDIYDVYTGGWQAKYASAQAQYESIRGTLASLSRCVEHQYCVWKFCWRQKC